MEEGKRLQQERSVGGFMGGQEIPRAPAHSKLALDLVKPLAEHLKLELHNSMKVTGQRVQVDCAESTSSLPARRYSTEHHRSQQFIRHDVM